MKYMKKWGRLALLLCLLCMAAALAACSSKDPEPENPTGTTPPTQNEEITTMKPDKIYNPNAEVFDSFADLKKNADLLVSRVPCTVSTLGYHEANDGGAATYNVVNVKPQGPFEKLKDRLWVEMVAGEEIYPEQFGAKGDGVTDNSLPLNRAGAYAAYHKVKLVLREKDYATYEAVTFGGIDIQSQNAKISYYGMTANTAAVYVESNTNIYGTFNIWSIDNEIANSGERCGLMFGKYATESSVTNCYIENVVVTGGSKHTNAVFITGDSHDITIDRIYVPTGTIINRALLIHWGNASPYTIKHDANSHSASEGATPTQHPHDIHIGTIKCHDLVTFEGWEDGTSCAISLCGVYDIHVDEIILSNAMEVVHVTSGDFGYQYAEGALKDTVSRDIRIGKITATGVSGNLVYSLGRSIYEPAVDTWPEIHIGEAYAEGTGTNSRGLALHDTGLVDIGKMTLKGFGGRAVSVANATRNVTVDELNIIDHTGQVIVCDTKDGRSINSKVLIKKLNISGNINSANAVVTAREINELRVERLSIKGCQFTSLVSLGTNAFNVRVDEISCADGGALTASMVHAAVVIPDANNISLGNVLDGVALTSGESCAVAVEGADAYAPVEPPVFNNKLYTEQGSVGDVVEWANGKDVNA